MARKYSKSASEKVARAMKKREKGTLRSGGSGEKVTSRKQAIAIGLSEARAEGKKVPRTPKKMSRTSAKPSVRTTAKTTGRKASAKKAAKKTTTKQTAKKKAANKKTAKKKSKA